MKRAQITVFMIVALVIVIAAATLISFLSQKTMFFPSRVIPPYISPIRNYIDSCVNVVSQDAIARLGQQGGYVVLPNSIKNNPAKNIFFFGPYKVPYWYYDAASHIPSEKQMEQQISDYIEENINDCIQDLASFRQDFDIEIVKQPAAQTKIAENDVVINVDYRLKIKNIITGEETKLKDFSVHSDVKLKKIYELAKKILEAENKDGLFENMTVNLIAMNPKTPLTGMDFRCDQLTWNILDVRKELQSMVYYTAPLVRIKNTGYAPFSAPESVYEEYGKYHDELRKKAANINYLPEDEGLFSIPEFTDTQAELSSVKAPSAPLPEDAYDYFHYFWDVKTKPSDLKVGFRYQPIWGIDLAVRPSKDGLLKSNTGKTSQKFLSFMCVNIYHFTYDVSYPVEVMLSDDAAFNGNGFSFHFAIPIMLKSNEARRTTEIAPAEFNPPIEDAAYCGQRSPEAVEIRATGKREGLSNMELNAVNISFTCGRYRCNLGQTKQSSGSYQLITNLPSFCKYGNIEARKEGYMDAVNQFIKSPFTIELKALKSLDFEIVKRKTTAPASELQLAGDESVTIYLSQEDGSYDLYRAYPFDSTMPESDKKIDLLDEDTTYNLFLILTKGEKMIGGYKGIWSVSELDLEGKTKIKFNVIEKAPTPVTNDDQMNLIGDLEKQEYQTQLVPVLE
ncbi:MAG: hypothetical protein Q7J54_05080 [Candidatus Woesearchaeota archaeon]|nr:hypothetical protein [Candidatus Woesearchaeota archaeon]